MALGRGLGELLGEVESAYENSTRSSKSGVLKLDVTSIKANPNQPRKIFDEEKLNDLSESIKEHGLLQPIVVIENEDSTYTLIAGERRLRAHKLANIDKIKAIIIDADEFKLRELALIENIQRDDLNIIELAYCYAQLLNEHSITHEELSRKVFKSRTSITNTLRLLQLNSYVQQFLASDKISAGHAKVMLGLTSDEQKMVCDSIIGQKLSVRETEKLVSMRALSAYSRTQIEGIIRQRINYLHTKLMVLDTHFVSGTSGASERTQATPRKDEFNIISIDIVLRYNEHKFLFANPQHLDSSGKDETVKFDEADHEEKIELHAGDEVSVVSLDGQDNYLAMYQIQQYDE